jgi:hypothetical protein
VIRAVVFDLWQTLALWPDERSREHRRAWSESLGVAPERLDELWYSDELYRLRETGPIADAISVLYERLGVDVSPDDILRLRLELTQEALTPVAGANRPSTSCDGAESASGSSRTAPRTWRSRGRNRSSLVASTSPCSRRRPAG